MATADEVFQSIRDARGALSRLTVDMRAVQDEARGWWFGVKNPDPIPALIVSNAAAVNVRAGKAFDALSRLAAMTPIELGNAGAQVDAARELVEALVSEARTLTEITAGTGIEVDFTATLPTLEDAARGIVRVVLAPVREVIEQVTDAAGDVIERAGEAAGDAIGNVGGGALDAVGRGWLFGLGALFILLRFGK